MDTLTPGARVIGCVVALLMVMMMTGAQFLFGEAPRRLFAETLQKMELTGRSATR